MSEKRKIKTLFFMGLFFCFFNKKCSPPPSQTLQDICTDWHQQLSSVILQLFFHLTRAAPATPHGPRALPLISKRQPLPRPETEEARGGQGNAPGSKRERGKGMCRRYLFIVQVLVPGVEGLSLLLSNKNPSYSLFKPTLLTITLSYFLLLFQTPYLRRQKPKQIELCRKCRHS